MSFLWRVSGLSLMDGVRSSDIQREFGVELLLLGVKKSVLGSPRRAWKALLEKRRPGTPC